MPPQEPNEGSSSSNPDTSQNIRESILQWHNDTPPPPRYIQIKGPSEREPKGYPWKCTVFSGPSPPTPDVGDISDIYIDTGGQSIYAKTEPEAWTLWKLEGKLIRHPLGGPFGLHHQLHHGIRWQTNISFTTHRCKFPAVRQMNVEDIIAQTFIYHVSLDPNNPDGVGRIGVGKEVRARKKGKGKAPSRGKTVVPTPAPQRDTAEQMEDGVDSQQPPPPPPRDPSPQPDTEQMEDGGDSQQPPLPPPRDPSPQPEDGPEEDFNMGWDGAGEGQDVDMDSAVGVDDSPRRPVNDLTRVYETHRITKPLHELADCDVGVSEINMLDLLDNYVKSNDDEGWMTIEMAKEDLKAFDIVSKAPEVPSTGSEEPARKKKAYTVDKKTLAVPESAWQNVSRSE
jgi:hypothetical protein